MSNEKVLFQDKQIKITNTRAIFGNRSFVMGHIASVSIGKLPKNKTLPVIFWSVAVILLGFSCLIVPLGFMELLGFVEGLGNKVLFWGIVMGFIAILFIGIGIVIVKSTRPTYAVRVGSSSGEADVLVSKDIEYLDNVVEAINEAIALQ